MPSDKKTQPKIPKKPSPKKKLELDESSESEISDIENSLKDNITNLNPTNKKKTDNNDDNVDDVDDADDDASEYYNVDNDNDVDETHSVPEQNDIDDEERYDNKEVDLGVDDVATEKENTNADCIYTNVRHRDDDDDELNDEETYNIDGLDDDEFEIELDESEDEKVKDKKHITFDDDEQITTNKLTKYERVAIIGERARQIELGAQPIVQNIKGMKPIDIAKLELTSKRCPIYVKRTLPSGVVIIIDVNKLKIVN